jgi:hypothetical protein
LIHLSVGQSNATVRPIKSSVQCTDPSKAIFNPVDFHVTARTLATLAGLLAINFVGIRKVKGAVEPAICILRIDDVRAFGGLVIAPAGLGPDRPPPERDPES